MVLCVCVHASKDGPPGQGPFFPCSPEVPVKSMFLGLSLATTGAKLDAHVHAGLWVAEVKGGRERPFVGGASVAWCSRPCGEDWEEDWEPDAEPTWESQARSLQPLGHGDTLPGHPAAAAPGTTGTCAP